MCAIAGLLSQHEHNWDDLTTRLQRVIQVQNHRGPDANGTYINGKVGFAHNRLSILDLSEAGNQPMTSRSGGSTIAYNGEVYNFREIAVELGIERRTRSDTEVILEGFERFGPDLIERLNGMFAFALHDRIKHQVWLVRDRLGIKPLYYTIQAGQLAFASEIKGIFTLLPDLERRLRKEALHEWAYYGNALGTKSMFSGIEQVAPGHSIRIDLNTGSHKSSSYWSLPKAIQSLKKDPEMEDPIAAARRTREIVEASLKRHLVSDVPVGIFLSGGIDSSTIAALASKNVSEPLDTYTAVFDDDMKNSEQVLASKVARAAGTNHHEIRIQDDDLIGIVEEMVDCHDLPFSDAANIPLNLMCRNVSGKHKVILQGDGGDEMFAGYRRYLLLHRFEEYLKFLKPCRPLGLLPVRGRLYQRFSRMLCALTAPTDGEIMASLLTLERRVDDPSQIFSDQVRNSICENDPFSSYESWDRKFPGHEIADKMLLTDKSIILPDIFFQKVDRSTMAASVEVRVPFADNEILNHVLGLSPSILMHGGRLKGLLRDAMSDVLPAQILTSKKRGFGVPFDKWISGPLSGHLQDCVASVDARYPSFLNRAHVDNLIQSHLSGRADHSFMIWKIFNLCLWMTRQKVAL